MVKMITKRLKIKDLAQGPEGCYKFIRLEFGGNVEYRFLNLDKDMDGQHKDLLPELTAAGSIGLDHNGQAFVVDYQSIGLSTRCQDHHAEEITQLIKDQKSDSETS